MAVGLARAGHAETGSVEEGVGGEALGAGEGIAAEKAVGDVRAGVAGGAADVVLLQAGVAEDR